MRKTLCIAVVALALATACVAPLCAQDNGKREDGEGQFAQLSATWWKWALAQPALDVDGTNTNPVIDTTGAYATAGQGNGIGPGNRYFFLAGTFGGVADRTVTVPAGKALFFPIYNWEVDNAVAPPTDYTVPELRAIAKAAVDGFPGGYALLNGRSLQMLRTESPVFEYTLPPENSIYDYFGMVGPQFEGTIRPAVADGIWVYVPPLGPGSYSLEFATTGYLAVKYHLTIQ